MLVCSARKCNGGEYFTSKLCFNLHPSIDDSPVAQYALLTLMTVGPPGRQESRRRRWYITKPYMAHRRINALAHPHVILASFALVVK